MTTTTPRRKTATPAQTIQPTSGASFPPLIEATLIRKSRLPRTAKPPYAKATSPTARSPFAAAPRQDQNNTCQTRCGGKRQDQLARDELAYGQSLFKKAAHSTGET